MRLDDYIMTCYIFEYDLPSGGFQSVYTKKIIGCGISIQSARDKLKKTLNIMKYHILI